MVVDIEVVFGNTLIGIVFVLKIDDIFLLCSVSGVKDQVIDFKTLNDVVHVCNLILEFCVSVNQTLPDEEKAYL